MITQRYRAGVNHLSQNRVKWYVIVNKELKFWASMKCRKLTDLELFNLPTLMHNSLFINNMYVTLLSSTCFEH